MQWSDAYEPFIDHDRYALKDIFAFRYMFISKLLRTMPACNQRGAGL